VTRAAAWIVGALLASGVVLVTVELGMGALDEPSPKIAKACAARPGRTGGFDTTVQRIVLDGLDGAACRLHTTREELVLSLGGDSVLGRRWSKHTIEVALRAGLLRSVADAERRGDVPSVLAPLLRQVVERAPLAKLIQRGVSLRDLLG